MVSAVSPRPPRPPRPPLLASRHPDTFARWPAWQCVPRSACTVPSSLSLSLLLPVSSQSGRGLISTVCSYNCHELQPTCFPFPAGGYNSAARVASQFYSFFFFFHYFFLFLTSIHHKLIICRQCHIYHRPPVTSVHTKPLKVKQPLWCVGGEGGHAGDVYCRLCVGLTAMINI